MALTRAQSSMGGRSSAARLTPEQRSERARKASLAAVPARVEQSWSHLSETEKERIRRCAERP